jgi:hypothetical protein
MNQYKLHKGPDGVTWLSLEPMIADIQKNIVLVKKLAQENTLIDPAQLSAWDLKIMGLTNCLHMMQALVEESNAAT